MNVWICGDSFGVPDPEYGTCWTELLATNHTITNVCQVCASNAMISRQVDAAIAAQPNYIIVLFSASTRGEVRHGKNIVPYSIHSLDATTPFDNHQLRVLQEYAVEFFDIDLAIYTNRCIIESVLYRLKSSGIPFLFDQGGFEHASYGGVGQYFQEFNNNRSAICLWDYTPTRAARAHRPYYHIPDYATHRMIADYYNEQLTKA